MLILILIQINHPPIYIEAFSIFISKFLKKRQTYEIFIITIYIYNIKKIN